MKRSSSGSAGHSPALSRAGPSKAPHVHFQSDSSYRSVEMPIIPTINTPKEDGDSSESETENTTNDDESQLSQKYLLLVDQPTVNLKRNLSIKDIGVILDRLSSKIVDVEKLDRELLDGSFHWTIKAMIRGQTLRELGVVYAGKYYAICEHPEFYSELNLGGDDDDDDENDDDDDEDDDDSQELREENNV